MSRIYTIEEIEFTMNDVHGNSSMNVAISTTAFKTLVGLTNRSFIWNKVEGRSIYYRNRETWIEDRGTKVIMNKALKEDIEKHDGGDIEAKIRAAYIDLDAIRQELHVRFL